LNCCNCIEEHAKCDVVKAKETQRKHEIPLRRRRKSFACGTAISTIYLSASFIVVFLCIATTETWPLTKRYNKKNHSNVIGNKEGFAEISVLKGNEKTTKRMVKKTEELCDRCSRNLCAKSSFFCEETQTVYSQARSPLFHVWSIQKQV
jgi:hypothetical protein